MPFTPPSTYASQANSGYLGQFGYGSPLQYIAEVKSMNISRYTVPKLNRTHLLSPNATEEYTPGLQDPGVVDCSGNYIGDVTQVGNLDTLAIAQTVFTYVFTLPVQNRSKTCTITGLGFLAKYDIGPIEGNRPIEFAFSIQTAGFASITTV